MIFMVTITNFKQATNADGREFFILEIISGVESVQSKNGGFYFTARKALVSTTFNEATCHSLLQTKMPGGIERVDTEPYSYTIPESGETIELSGSWGYNPNLQSMEEASFQNDAENSQNI